jgi:SAM-dependent methyltransferase
VVVINMGIIGGELGYRILTRISPNGESRLLDGSAYKGKSKLETLLGSGFWDEIRDRVVVDFGCGTGADSIEIAQRGARRVIGIDIQERFLEVARKRADHEGVGERCRFATQATETADLIVAIDSFEHFDDPSAILKLMSNMIRPEGWITAAFGPTWYHPLGGHLFSVFPWAHLLFTERALVHWRSDFKTDGATRFNEVEGGLARLTVRGFERAVAASPLQFAEFETVPIRKLKPIANRLTRELTTSILRCRLVRRG